MLLILKNLHKITKKSLETTQEEELVYFIKQVGVTFNLKTYRYVNLTIKDKNPRDFGT